MDATLGFLYSSAVSKGIAHKYTENSALLLGSFSRLESPTRKITWDPQKPNEAVTQAANVQAKRDKEGPRKARIEQAVRGEWALKQTQMMAEGMGGIILGRKLSAQKTQHNATS